MYTCSFLECSGKQTFELQQQQKQWASLSSALLSLVLGLRLNILWQTVSRPESRKNCPVGQLRDELILEITHRGQLAGGHRLGVPDTLLLNKKTILRNWKRWKRCPKGSQASGPITSQTSRGGSVLQIVQGKKSRGTSREPLLLCITPHSALTCKMSPLQTTRVLVVFSDRQWGLSQGMPGFRVA